MDLLPNLAYSVGSTIQRLLSTLKISGKSGHFKVPAVINNMKKVYFSCVDVCTCADIYTSWKTYISVYIYIYTHHFMHANIQLLKWTCAQNHYSLVFHGKSAKVVNW